MYYFANLLQNSDFRQLLLHYRNPFWLFFADYGTVIQAVKSPLTSLEIRLQVTTQLLHQQTKLLERSVGRHFFTSYYGEKVGVGGERPFWHCQIAWWLERQCFTVRSDCPTSVCTIGDNDYRIIETSKCSRIFRIYLLYNFTHQNVSNRQSRKYRWIVGRTETWLC